MAIKGWTTEKREKRHNHKLSYQSYQSILLHMKRIKTASNGRAFNEFVQNGTNLLQPREKSLWN